MTPYFKSNDSVERPIKIEAPAGETVKIGDYDTGSSYIFLRLADPYGVGDGVPNGLSLQDKIAFWIHVTEIQKGRSQELWHNPILNSYCNRTGVSKRWLMHAVWSGYWDRIQAILLRTKLAA